MDKPSAAPGQAPTDGGACFDVLVSQGESARAAVMRWAVATAALQQRVKDELGQAPSWLDVSDGAQRWVDHYGRKTGKWTTADEAGRALSDELKQPSLPPRSALDRWDRALSLAMQRYGFRLLRWSLGLVFIWFGALKPLGLSPANELVTATVTFIPPAIFIPLLGVWEVLIGLGLLFRPLLRASLLLLFAQLPGTALPLLLLPEVCFTHFPYGLTLEGQYIIKNLTLASAAIVVGGTVRHGAQRGDQERVTWLL